MKQFAVIGSGTMGRGIAYVAALGDFQVHVHDVSEEALAKAKDYIEKEMRKKRRAGLSQPCKSGAGPGKHRLYHEHGRGGETGGYRRGGRI